ncbi:uroporphyrinogen decarboxylase [Alphaproteobacteria bacterium]|nr:uroporphyrinogen decarboxylase [Alphaproteobacteria bacterium]
MDKKTNKILKVLSGEKVSPPPVWLMRQAGRYLPEYRKTREKAGSFLDLCYNPILASEVTLQPIKRFNFDAAILFADILLVCDALGQNIKFIENIGPVLEPVRSFSDFNNLSLNKHIDKLYPVYETVDIVKNKLSENIPLIGFAGSPWTVATYMIEGKSSKNYEYVKLLSYNQKDLFNSIIELITEITIQYLKKQIKYGAKIIQLFDSWSGILSENDFHKWCIVPTKTIVKELKNTYPGIPIIGFPRGSGEKIKDYVEITNIDCVGLDTTISISLAKDLQNKVIIQGNLDPIALLADKSYLIKESKYLLRNLSKGPYIFNLGHGILPQTPIDNVSHLLDTIRSNQYE